jgi:hypothetical protein
MIFQIFDFAMSLSFFKARRTQVLPVEWDITQSAQKPSTDSTWNDGLFSRVIKATGLIVHLQCRTGLSHRQQAVDGRKNIDPQTAAACGTCNQ